MAFSLSRGSNSVNCGTGEVGVDLDGGEDGAARALERGRGAEWEFKFN